MFGKIVQLLEVPLEEEFKTVYGMEDTDFKHSVRWNLGFGEIAFFDISPKSTRTYINGGYLIDEVTDGFKSIYIFNGELSKDDNEDYLLVIIPHATIIKSESKKIAGRYPCEAILKMRAGDTVEIARSLNGKRYTYIAVKAGNEMFLIKKER